MTLEDRGLPPGLSRFRASRRDALTPPGHPNSCFQRGVCHVAHLPLSKLDAVRSRSAALGGGELSEAVRGALVDDDLVAATVRASPRVAARRVRDRVLEPRRDSPLIRVRLPRLRRRFGAPCGFPP